MCQTQKGANLSVKMDFYFTSEYHKNEFKASASAGIADWEICCKPFSASFNASIEKLSESTQFRIACGVVVSAYQVIWNFRC